MSKLKLNFATRVTTLVRPKSQTEFNSEKAKIQAETNSRKLVLDRSVFTKTEDEKEALKEAKNTIKL